MARFSSPVCLTALGILLAAAPTTAQDAPPLPEGLVRTDDGRIELAPDLRAELAEHGWPPALPEIRPTGDTLVRRSSSPILGDLELLQAFARIVPPSTDEEQERIFVGRAQIVFVLLNGKTLPDEIPLLSPTDDSVVRTNGEVLVGPVTITGATVTCGAQTLTDDDVALIRLKDPATEVPPRVVPNDPPDVVDPPANPPTEGGGEGKPAGGEGADGGERGSGGGAADGECWVGWIDYTIREKNDAYPGGWQYEWRVRERLVLRERVQSEQAHGVMKHVLLDLEASRWRVEEEHNTLLSWFGPAMGDDMPHKHERYYWVTSYPVIKEAGTTFGHELDPGQREVGNILYVDPKAIADLPRKLKEESPGLTDEMLQPIVDAIVGSTGTGETRYQMLTPGFFPGVWPGLDPRETVYTIDEYCEHDTPIKSWEEPHSMLGSVGVLIGHPEEGDQARTFDPDQPVMRGGYFLPARKNPPLFRDTLRVSWSFEKSTDCSLPPFPDMPPDDPDPCAEYRRKLADAEFRAQDYGDEMNWVGEELARAEPELRALAKNLEALRPYFELALVLSATSDLSQTLLKAALAKGLGGMAQAGGQSASMAARIEAVMTLLSLLGDGPTWLWKDGVNEASKSVLGKRRAGKLGNPADVLEVLQRLEVLVAYASNEDLDVVMNYVDKNLSMWVGSDYVVEKARGYVEQVRVWQEKNAELLPIVARAYRLDYEIFRAEADAEFWRRELEDCLREQDAR